ncbi:hypothetical protein TKK_0002586 [Trichogramma kaykai]|uniref:Ribonuclease H1 n=1 Tax=Trichogramma kaykai TaxID=54128 RepID=A0ABD2WY59_9HYME
MYKLYSSQLHKQLNLLKCPIELNIISNSIMSFYAVAKGRNPGIYYNWSDCEVQIKKFSGARYKKFSTAREAENFINLNSDKPKNDTQQGSSSSKKVSKYCQNISSLKRDFSKISPEEKINVSSKRIKIIDPPKQNKNVDGFLEDENGYIEVYTDGACKFNGRGNAKAGFGVWFGDNHPLNVVQALDGKATNNRAEIKAVTMAAEQAEKAGIKKLRVNTDSQFLIDCITKWMPNWKKNGWVTSKNETPKNKTELIEMDEACAKLDVKFNHVRGHCGIHGNEMADRLANLACERSS